MTLFISLILLIVHFQVQGSVLQEKLESYFEKNNTPYLTKFRFYTYLYAAQKDAGAGCGSLQKGVEAALIKLFFPDFGECTEACSDIPRVITPYLERFRAEEMSKRVFTSQCWLPQMPEVAKWIPWQTPLPQPPPPLASDEQKDWSKQFETLRTLRRNLTQEQLHIIREWVGKHGKNSEWRALVNRYMEEHHVPEAKVLQVRALLMKGLYDGVIAEYEAKFTYCIPRPYMMDPAFEPLIPKLNTPSYPSGHAIQGSISATILTYFFPGDAAYWKNLDEEGANTRLWEGVHFPEDIEQGRILGKKIGEQLITQEAGNGQCLDALQGGLQALSRIQQREISGLASH